MTSSELVEPLQDSKQENKKKKKKTKLEEPLLIEEEEKEEDPNAVSKFRISKPLREKLKEKGIETTWFWFSGGRTIIFTETKESASQLAGLLPGVHGDIQQSQCEVTLSGFRSGKFMTLVATNVAARGLDINDFQLIIQCEPPRDVEAYIHPSGRTGRAGNTGVAVMLYDPRRSSVSRIERESGVKFKHISAPQPDDIAKAVGGEAAEMITQVSDRVIPAFKSAAEELLNNSGSSVVDLLAKALAKAVGYTEIKRRSLLTSIENYVTLLLEIGRPIYTPSFAYGVLRRFFPEEKVEAAKGLILTADGNGFVFDVPAEDLDTYLAGPFTADICCIIALVSVFQALTILERDGEADRELSVFFVQCGSITA